MKAGAVSPVNVGFIFGRSYEFAGEEFERRPVGVVGRDAGDLVVAVVLVAVALDRPRGVGGGAAARAWFEAQRDLVAADETAPVGGGDEIEHRHPPGVLARAREWRPV